VKKKFELGVTNGCFDLLHKGHLYSLEQAKKYCKILIVLLNSDSSVKKIKGKNRPIQNQQIRKKRLLKTRYVDKVIIFEETTPLKKIKLIKPNVIFKGLEYKNKSISGKIFLEKNGGKVILLKRLKKISTTKIINEKKIKANNNIFI
tara:strand:+ start:6256 stop:6696 length:441 start_codon:yes stop_codon:yes gene_type:complete